MMSRADRFACTWPACGKTYSKSCKLEEHVRSHTNTRPFACTVEGCGKSFLRNGHLQRHCLTSHTDSPRRFACSVPDCNKSFTLRHHLRRHERRHVEPEPHKCDACKASFARREQLRRHQHTHEIKAAVTTTRVEKTYVCGMEGCSEYFAKWTLVVAHRRLAHPPTAIEACPECGKAFARRRNLQNHMRNVHHRVPGPMHECGREGCEGRSFSSRHAVKVHIATVHEGRKPYQCEACDRSFGHKHLLVRHRRTHAVKPVEQDRKEETAVSTEKGLLDALVGAPEDLSNVARKRRRREIECPVLACRRRFFRQYDLRRHTETAHPPPLPG